MVEMGDVCVNLFLIMFAKVNVDVSIFRDTKYEIRNMPDKRTHRGPHPADAKLFDATSIANLRSAVADLSLLLTKNMRRRAL